ncbi:Holliday junction resolvase RuvX [Geochorda subterranea]|uniref:Putative pre-16S rRNA nuclease n=1 Tax=Geochorda subterranea TaxID=3109564 RepID=A0ABZ1BKY0_9FIRM|nr:Holliday junction resolvase RuvX [Limnochorda sp. LNt]WRP13479.1 Holliday junction resolvase RuvX [Limnochorda sp. LNt]
MREQGGRILALDVGERRIGVAITDPTGATAQPLQTVVRTGQDGGLTRLVAMIRRYDVKEVVVGLPTRTGGEEGPEARRVRAFARRLRSLTGVPVVFVDERYSTREAERILLAADLSRGRRRKVLDHVAAAIVLDTYLARRRVGAGQGEAP